MPIELRKADKEWSLSLSGIVDIFDAAALHQAALEVSSGGSAGLVVLLEEAQTLDISTIQVLLALKRDLVASGRTIHFDGISTVLSELCRSAGLQDELK